MCDMVSGISTMVSGRSTMVSGWSTKVSGIGFEYFISVAHLNKY